MCIWGAILHLPHTQIGGVICSARSRSTDNARSELVGKKVVQVLAGFGEWEHRMNISARSPPLSRGWRDGDQNTNTGVLPWSNFIHTGQHEKKGTCY